MFDRMVNLRRGWITPAGRFIDLGGSWHVQVHSPHKIIDDLWRNRGKLNEAEHYLFERFCRKARVNLDSADEEDLEKLHSSAGAAPWGEAIKDIFESGYIRVAGAGIEIAMDPDSEPDSQAVAVLVNLIAGYQDDAVVFVDDWEAGTTVGWMSVGDLSNIRHFQDMIQRLSSVYESSGDSWYTKVQKVSQEIRDHADETWEKAKDIDVVFLWAEGERDHIVIHQEQQGWFLSFVDCLARTRKQQQFPDKESAVRSAVGEYHNGEPPVGNQRYSLREGKNSLQRASFQGQNENNTVDPLVALIHSALGEEDGETVGTA